MLTYFPRPMPDELLYSLIARFHRHTCERSPKRTLDDLFGDRSVRASVDLPGRLGALAARLPAALDMTPTRMAERLTLLPYYTAFQHADIRRGALQSMTMGSTDGLHMRLGVTASRIRPPNALRRCPACDAAALRDVGERWWRRSHQLPGVAVCPEHGVFLRATSARPGMAGQHLFLAADDHADAVAATPEWAGDAHVTSLMTEIACRSATLLGGSPPEQTANRGAFMAALVARDLATPNGSVRQRRLGALQTRVFAPLTAVLPEALRFEWLAAIVRRRRHVFHPLHHVLLDVLLDAAPLEQPKRDIRPRRFLADDAAFEARLRAAVASSSVLTRVARELGVDTNTVRRHATRLGLKTPWKPSVVAAVNPDTGTDRDHYLDWATLRDTQPALSRKALRIRLPAAHAWLRRRDPDWLERSSPPPLRRAPTRTRIDWRATDRRLADGLVRAAAELLAQEPPVRVTLASLERALGRPEWLAPRRAKLPKADAAARAVSETVAAFQTRRRTWVEQVLLAQGRAPEWRIRRLAGLRGDPPCTA